MICSCCGHEFSMKASEQSCDGCLSRNGCGLVKCPHCGFESAREPQFIQKLRGWFGGKSLGTSVVPTVSVAGPAAAALCLSDLKEGANASIESFTDDQKMRKFTSLGILPGAHVTVVKQFPAVVLRIGYSEFAFDRALAGGVRVHQL